MLTEHEIVDHVYEYVKKQGSKKRNGCLDMMCANKADLKPLLGESLMIFCYVELKMYECAFLTAIETSANLYAYPMHIIKWVLYGGALLDYTRRDVLDGAVNYMKKFDADNIGVATSQAYIPKTWDKQLTATALECHLAYTYLMTRLGINSTTILVGDALRRNKAEWERLEQVLIG
jgi:hypothetical protein